MIREPDDELRDGELTLHGRVMPASNATFVGQIGEVTVVYKPVARGAAAVGLPRRHLGGP